MRYVENALSNSTLQTLCVDVLHAYEPATNSVDLSMSHAIDEIRCLSEEVLQRHLRYYRAFLLLVSKTTIETANNNASEGWHVDSTCAHVDGPCYNAWIPLYNSSNNTGIEVITSANNPEIYSHLGDNKLPLDVFVRTSANEIFERLKDRCEADLILLRREASRSLVLGWRDVVVSSHMNPEIGDLALFQQTDIHRGCHDDGIRIQLSVKFLSSESKIMNVGPPPASALKSLSKHGRLEAQLIQELLRLSISKSKYSGRSGSRVA